MEGPRQSLLSSEPQQAAAGTLPKSLGTFSRYSEETGKGLWRPRERFRPAFYGGWRTTGSRTKDSQNHRLLKLLASQMDPRNLSITSPELKDLGDDLVEPLIVQPEK